jgi:hypothetical protein
MSKLRQNKLWAVSLSLSLHVDSRDSSAGPVRILPSKSVGISPYRIDAALTAAAKKAVHWSRIHSGLEELRIFGGEGIVPEDWVQQLLLALMYGARLYEDESGITIPPWSASRGRLKQLPPGSAEVPQGLTAEAGLEDAGTLASAWSTAHASSELQPMSDGSTTDLCVIADRIFKELANPRRTRRANTPEREQRLWWRRSAKAQTTKLHMDEVEKGNRTDGSVLGGAKFWLRDLKSDRFVIATVFDWQDDASDRDPMEWGQPDSKLVFKAWNGTINAHVEGCLLSDGRLLPERIWSFDRLLYEDSRVSMAMGAVIPSVVEIDEGKQADVAVAKGQLTDTKGSANAATASAMTDLPQTKSKKLRGIPLVHEWISPIHISDEIARIITDFLLLAE